MKVFIKIALLLLIFVNSFISFSQPTNLNKLNSKGKKTGYWLQYLDNNLLVTDSVNSFFKGYEYYDEGQKVFKFESEGFRKKNKAKYKGILPEKGRPVLINGTFIWTGEKDTIPFIEERYKEGHPEIFKEYFKDSIDGIIKTQTTIDFTKTYNNITGTFYYEELSPTKGLKKYYFRKEKGYWKSCRVK